MAQPAWLTMPDRDTTRHGGHSTGFGLSPQSRLPPLSEIGRFSPGTSSSYAAPRVVNTRAPYRPMDYTGNGQAMHYDSGNANALPVDTRHTQTREGYSTEAALTDNSQIYQSQQFTYDVYPQQNSPDFQRYRDNSTTSLSTNFGTSSSLYNPQYSSSVSSFSSTASGSTYEISPITSLANGKGSYGLHAESPIYPPSNPQSPLYPDHGFDRRPSDPALASNYTSRFPEEYGVVYDPNVQISYNGDIRDPMLPTLSPDSVQAIVPHFTNMLRDPPQATYEHTSSTMSSTPELSPDTTYMPPIENMLQDARLQEGMASNNLELFMRPVLDQYIRTPNRLAFGERTIIVMSSKVAQKSYGSEKRFICPPPTALLVGNSWWSDSHRPGDDKLRPPRVVISISGETPPPEAVVEWSGANGKLFNNINDPPVGTTYLGRCVGKQLYIAEVDEKRKKVEALVKVMAPVTDDGIDRVIGVFPSRPIKVISKPTKKRQSSKNLELCINHGTTVSMFHRLRSQTVSTRYLCVSSSASAIKGSDGAPLVGVDLRMKNATPSFIAKTSAWDPFVLYIVDTSHVHKATDAPLPPPQPEFPSPPPNAIPFTHNGSPIPVYYNQTVVLQCLTSGVVSPVLVIRKVDHTTTAIGGGSIDHAKGAADKYCPLGEVCGDPVSQLHKVAFEVHDSNSSATSIGSPGDSGAFLSCMGEKVNTYRPQETRMWSPRVQDSPIMTSASPLGTSQSFGSMVDYFGNVHHQADGMPPSPQFEFESNDGGRVKKKRSGSSAGGLRTRGPRRRPASSGSGSMSPSTPHFPHDGISHSSYHAGQWQVEVGETSVWTIVGVEQVRYNFYVPPVLLDNPHAPPSRSFPIPSKMVTPFPGVVKYLPADRAAEVVRSGHAWKPAQAHPESAKMLTLYGENFDKSQPPRVFFGADSSPFVEVRCNEVVGCLPPDQDTSNINIPLGSSRRPIILVRSDGVVYPTTTMYP